MRCRRPVIPAFVAAAAIAVLTAGCGGGSSPPSSSTSPDAAASNPSVEVLAFAACMRAHGVPNFPDPDHDGVFTLPSGVDQQAPQFQRATKACAKVQPSSLSILNQSPGNS